MKKILFLSAMLAATSPQLAVAADNAAAKAPTATTGMPAGPARSITPAINSSASSASSPDPQMPAGAPPPITR